MLNLHLFFVQYGKQCVSFSTNENEFVLISLDCQAVFAQADILQRRVAMEPTVYSRQGVPKVMGDPNYFPS